MLRMGMLMHSPDSAGCGPLEVVLAITGAEIPNSRARLTPTIAMRCLTC